MKRITKYLLLGVIGLFSLNSYSQILGFKGGINHNDVLFENETGIVSNATNMTLQGFHFGATIDNPLSESLSLEMGLMLSLKGYKIDELLDGITVRNKTNLYYIDIPVAFKYAFGLGRNSNWYLAAGPVFDIGVGGNYMTVYDWSGSRQVEKEKVEWGNEEGQIQRLDFGLTFGGGVEFDAWQIGVYYDLGLSDISSDATPDNTLKNRVWKLSLGYKFDK